MSPPHVPTKQTQSHFCFLALPLSSNWNSNEHLNNKLLTDILNALARNLMMRLLFCLWLSSASSIPSSHSSSLLSTHNFAREVMLNVSKILQSRCLLCLSSFSSGERDRNVLYILRRQFQWIFILYLFSLCNVVTRYALGWATNSRYLQPDHSSITSSKDRELQVLNLKFDFSSSISITNRVFEKLGMQVRNSLLLNDQRPSTIFLTVW